MCLVVNVVQPCALSTSLLRLLKIIITIYVFAPHFKDMVENQKENMQFTLQCLGKNVSYDCFEAT